MPILPLIARAALIFLMLMVLAIHHRRWLGERGPFGAANGVTAVRGALTAVVLALMAEPASGNGAWAAVALGCAVTALDGVDGWLARRHGTASAFGARFDMEVDALLILALAIMAWRHDKSGGWVVASGLMRYGFVLAGWVWAWLNAPLFPSLRRKAVCVIQIGVLLLVLAPPVGDPVSRLLAAAGVVTLAWSFGIDAWWLWRQASEAGD